MIMKRRRKRIKLKNRMMILNTVGLDGCLIDFIDEVNEIKCWRRETVQGWFTCLL